MEKIFFRDHETMDTEFGEKCTLELKGLLFIADSFDELCEKINPLPHNEYEMHHSKRNPFVSFLRTLCEKL